MKKNIIISATKKLAAVIIFTSLFFGHVTAQKKSSTETPFHKGSKSIGLLVGLPLSYNYYGSYTPLPTLGITYDQGIKDNLGPGNLGVGGVIALNSATYRYSTGNYKAYWRNYIIGVRGTYHLTLLADKNNKFDPYAGVTVGLRIYDYKDTYYTSRSIYNYNSVYPIIGAFVGAKYHFSKAFGAFVEAGYDISFVRGGICINF